MLWLQVTSKFEEKIQIPRCHLLFPASSQSFQTKWNCYFLSILSFHFSFPNPKSTFSMFLCLATMLITEDMSPDSSQRQLWIIPVYLHYISYTYAHVHTYIYANTFIKIWDGAEIKPLISNKQFPSDLLDLYPGSIPLFNKKKILLS